MEKLLAINEKKSPYKPNGGIDGDIEMLRKNCEMLASDPKMREQFRRVISNIKGLDVKPIFTSEHTKGMLSAASGIRLRGDSLNAISKIYLGEGKLEDLMGPEVESLSPEIQRLYCLQDAILPLKLIQKENFNLLKIFYSLAEESDVDFILILLKLAFIGADSLKNGNLSQLRPGLLNGKNKTLRGMRIQEKLRKVFHI
jgi:hypothetical protein